MTITLKEPTQPLVLLDTDRNKRLMALQGYIMLIKKPNDPQLYGPVENSFSLGVEPNRTFFFWTSLAMGIDGWAWVNEDVAYWKKQYPDWEFTIYDARDEAIPVTLNWELWLDAHERSSETLSGIKNKHEARNLRFTPKGTIDSRKVAPALKMNITTYSLKQPKEAL
jgi:hypothetical protein